TPACDGHSRCRGSGATTRAKTPLPLNRKGSIAWLGGPRGALDWYQAYAAPPLHHANGREHPAAFLLWHQPDRLPAPLRHKVRSRWRGDKGSQEAPLPSESLARQSVRASTFLASATGCPKVVAASTPG